MFIQKCFLLCTPHIEANKHSLEIVTYWLDNTQAILNDWWKGERMDWILEPPKFNKALINRRKDLGTYGAAGR